MSMKSKKTKYLTIRTTEELILKLKKQAEKEHRRYSNLVEHILYTYLERFK